MDFLPECRNDEARSQSRDPMGDPSVPDASLQLPPATHADPANDVAASERRAGERVGAYELLRLLGAGGMAEVWLARRTDGTFEGEVALKISRLPPVHAGMAARFAQECSVLAALESPGIARLYDAGVDASGVPYFAMEHVHGAPLTSWCDQRGLGLTERVRIFLQVLEAVGHAHVRNVIHRDLKPSNILVTGDGEVRLLDFGVAQLLQEQSAGQRSLTQSFGRAMTPEYASPELLRGREIDARSDIYSLGVVLHELVTGVLPGQSRPDSTQRIVLPSGMREVLAKAMETDPADRHADVSAFAADLRRFEPGRGGTKRPPGARLRYVAIGVLVAAAAILAVLWQRGVLTDTSPAPDAADILFQPGIAVLPFSDLSEAQDQAYLGDGFAEELLNLLSRIPALRVTARASSFAFRGAPAETSVIAKKLNVDHILEGSVRRAGNRLRLSVQLVQAATGTVLWSKKYDRELQDIFDVQEDVSNAVVDALKLRQLTRQVVPPGERTRNTRAYEEYLLGLQLRDGLSMERQLLARAAFERAVQLDPRFAAAHAGLALSAAQLGDMTMDAGHLEVAWEEAGQAIALAPKLAVAYVARARVHRARSWDFQGERRDLDTARAIEPDNVEVLQAWGAHLAATGRFPEAVELQRQGVERDPMASAAWELLGAALMGARDYKAAGNAFARASELSPNPDRRLQSDTLIALYSGNHVEALRLANLNKDSDQRDFCLALAEFSAGNATAAREAVQRLIERAPDLRAAQISRAYAWFGDKDQAFHWLNRAIELHHPGITAILGIPEFDGLRRDARYQRALFRMQLDRE